MTLALASIADGPSILRAIGLLRSVMAHDDTHVAAIMEAAIEDPDDLAVLRTFGAMVGIAAAAVASLACANVYSDDVDEVLDVIQRHIVVGDVPPPEARPEATP